VSDIFPNPVQNILHIASSQILVNNVSIYDLSGRVVLENQNSNLDIKIDVSGLNTSMYFVQMDTENGTVTKRFVKR